MGDVHTSAGLGSWGSVEGRALLQDGSSLQMESELRPRAFGGGKIIICISLRSENSAI